MNERLSSLLLLSVLVTSTSGCFATTRVHRMGRYDSDQLVERGVVLTDGRVVVDFSERRTARSRSVALYHRRAYLEPDAPLRSGAPAAPGAGELAPAHRVALQLEAMRADDAPGAWTRPDAAPPRFPPIPEQASRGRCAGFRERPYETYCNSATPALDMGACLRGPVLAVCDERSGQEVVLDAAYTSRERSTWWFRPSRVLYVPAIAWDLVTFPIQAAVAVHELHEYGRRR